MRQTFDERQHACLDRSLTGDHSVTALAGLFHRDGRAADAHVVDRMVRALDHRGADRTAISAEGPASLGHGIRSGARSAVTRGIAPAARGPGLIIVADARIDNADELRHLVAADATYECSDAELILRAYVRWGARCPARLLGDFAFAIWDGRSQSVFCARDPMGVKPFYYHVSERLLVFASEAKALFRCGAVSDTIDDLQVAFQVAGIHEDRRATVHRDVWRLPAGHTMLVTRDAITHAEYWNADAARDVRFTSDGDYEEAFRDIMTDAVAVRLRGAHQVGAALSGGLDSSSVVCLARAIRGADVAKPLHTFSLVFPGVAPDALRLIDERPYMEAVLRGGGLESHLVRGDRLTPLADVDRMLWHLDEPFLAPNLYLHWGMFSAARDAGVRVFLDGFDGDSAVSHGFGRLNGLMRRGAWPLLEAEVRAFASHRGVAPEAVLQHFALPYVSELARRGAWVEWLRAARELTRRFSLSRRDTVVHCGILPMLPEFVERTRRLFGARAPSEVAMLQPALARRVEPLLRGSARRSARRAADTERAMHVAAISQPMYQLTLEIADKCARAFGIEPRYPFFDRRVIEFCIGVPDEQRLAGGWPRSLLRRAMSGILPDEIRWRSTKGNLAPNFDTALRTTDRARIAATADIPELTRYVDIEAFRRVDAAFDAGGRGWRDTDGPLLFRTAVLGRWLSSCARQADTIGPIEASPDGDGDRIEGCPLHDTAPGMWDDRLAGHRSYSGRLATAAHTRPYEGAAALHHSPSEGSA